MIGNNIVEAREKVHLSQTELAERIGITRHLMYKYEHNIITNIPSDKIEMIARVCQTTPAKIMGWDISTEDELVKLIGQLNEDEKVKVVDYINLLLGQVNHNGGN